MPGPLTRFEAEPPHDLVATLKVMESRIDGLVSEPERARWDIDSGDVDSCLVYASRVLTYPRPRPMVGREQLVVAMARLSQGSLFAIQDRFESLEWSGGVEITADDVFHGVFRGARNHSLPEAADRLLTNLKNAKPDDHNTYDVVDGLKRGLFRMRSE